MRIKYSDVPARVEVAGAQLCLWLPLPHLAGEQAEVWPLGADGAASATGASLSAQDKGRAGKSLWRKAGDWHIAEAGDCLWGCVVADGGDACLEANTRELYGQLLAMLGQHRLQRVWHFIPRINDCDASGLERYRAFCRGRSVAFEQFFATAFNSHFPAASAVGCEGGSLVVYACARKGALPHYIENPLQVPAYRYPPQYGPRAPGFARASVTDGADPELAQRPHLPVTGAGSAGIDAANHPHPEAVGERACAPSSAAAETGAERPAVLAVPSGSAAWREVYISGTASIRAAESLTDGGLLGQLETTIENLNQIAVEAGIAPLLGEPVGKGVSQNAPDSGLSSINCGEAGAQGIASAAGGGCTHAAASSLADGARHSLADATEHSLADAAELLLADGRCERHFRVYLRRAEDCAAVAARFNALLRQGDTVSYVRSDICRAELDIEIEASVRVYRKTV